MPQMFFTADTHFDHPGIIITCDRPLNTVPGYEDGKWHDEACKKQQTEEMNEYLVDGWNKMVTGRDITYILGDFAWKNHSKFLGRLKGKKILIRGNHDRMSREVLKLFTEVHDIRELKLPNGRTAVCCHYCLNSWNHSNKGAYHFHGHSHGRIEEKRGLLRCDVGVDVWDYQPVPVEVLIEKMKFSEKAWCGYERFPGEANEFIGRNHSANRVMRKKLGLPSLAMDRETELLG